MDMTVRPVPISDVHVAERIRHDNGDIDALAKDIVEHGLLNPITVMQQAGGGYMLVAGLRRLKAVEQLGDADIPAKLMSPMEADEALMLEIVENEQRKDFTTSERLSYAERIKAVDAEKANARMLAGKRQDNPVANLPQGKKGRTRDIVAHKVGFGSATQMRHARRVSDERPDLMEAVDKGERTINSAYVQMMRESKENQCEDSKHQIEQQRDGNLDGGKPVGAVQQQNTRTESQHTDKAQNKDSEAAHEERVAPGENDSVEKGNGTEPGDVLDTMESLVDCGIIEEKIVEVPFYEEVYRPEKEPAPGNPRTLKGADHRHLLENPIYSRLYEEYDKAVKEINKSRGETQLRSEGYERQIRSYKENLQACQREILRLRGLLSECRAKQQ